MKTPAVLREAARNIEENSEGVSVFPCVEICRIEAFGSHFTDSKNALAFMSIFSDKEGPFHRSGDYIENINPMIDKDSVILSLCFAAAIIEAGDAP